MSLFNPLFALHWIVSVFPWVPLIIQGWLKTGQPKPFVCLPFDMGQIGGTKRKKKKAICERQRQKKRKKKTIHWESWIWNKACSRMLHFTRLPSSIKHPCAHTHLPYTHTNTPTYPISSLELKTNNIDTVWKEIFNITTLKKW